MYTEEEGIAAATKYLKKISTPSLNPPHNPKNAAKFFKLIKIIMNLELQIFQMHLQTVPNLLKQQTNNQINVALMPRLTMLKKGKKKTVLLLGFLILILLISVNYTVI